jgi:hypothetical protein
MANDSEVIEHTVQQLLKSGSRLGSLTDVERLIIRSIVKKVTYRQAGLDNNYTESSLQNVASRLFRELSSIVGMPIGRRNFLEVMQKELVSNPVAKVTEIEDIAFDRLQANFWIRSNRAVVVSLGYSAQQELEMTGYLLKYSPQFEATFCVDVRDKASILEVLWDLCKALHIPCPTPRNSVAALLKSIGAVLQARSTLLVLRFDRMSGPALLDRRDLAEMLVELVLMDWSGSLLIVDRDPVGNDAELKRSLGYQLRSKLDVLSKVSSGDRRKLSGLRLVSIDGDRQTIFNLFQTYLR